MLSPCVRLSDGLMSALYALQKALGEPNAFSQQGAVSFLFSICSVINLFKIFNFFIGS